MYSRAFLTLLLACLPVSLLFAQTTVDLTDASINAGETLNLEASNTYLLDGFVFVEDGAVLNIEAGTVIKGKAAPTNGDNASALIVARGGQINATGTADAPIIFTAEADDVNDPGDLPVADNRGLWGGIIILGNATTNRGIEGQIEGIPSGEARATYGGDNDADNSGTLRYVSIRYGGAELGPGDEINGLTLGAVGSGTTIEYVEVFGNLDDGIEWFGGTVNTKWVTVAFCGDDAFDWDEGWRGNNQYWFAIQSQDAGGRVGEHDGGTIQETAPPFSTPTILNATYIGGGVDNFPQGDGSEAIIFRDNSGGSYINSIITEYNGANDGRGITVEDLDSGDDSRVRLENGDLTIASNLWWNFGNGNNLADFAPQDFVRDHLAANANQIVDPAIAGISYSANGGLDPRPTAAVAASGASAPGDAFFNATDFFGAFNPNAPMWIAGWTALAQNGYLAATSTTVELTDASINAGETLNLVASNTYILDGFVFVEDGAVLNIEAGTVIKGRATPSNGDNASALIIARGGQINAAGSAGAPIIFTAEADDIDDPNDLPVADNRGLWGGIIILGNATTNRGIEGQIEGIPSGEVRATYGGDNDADNSGTLRYVSIRYGGAELGPGDEINGLTLGAVGSGTTIEYVEVFGNLDDGIEWFGGTVNTKYMTVAFCGDDAFDWDEGWRGNNQYWFAIQSQDAGGRIGEHDGGTIQETAAPFSTPTILNATYIGGGVDNFPQGDGSEAIIFRDNSGGSYINSIITEYNGANDGRGITVEDLDSGDDSRTRLENGDLTIAGNLWWNFGNGNNLEDFAPQDFVRDHLVANANQIVDPAIAGISYVADGSLDPRPTAAVAASGAIAPGDAFFNATDFFGAFNPEAPLWLSGWTALSQNGYLAADRFVNHVTAEGGGFATTVFMDNTAATAMTIKLQPYDQAGNALTARSFTLAAGEKRNAAASVVFGGEAVSHFSISGSAMVNLAVGYKAADFTSATAHVNETSMKATSFTFYPGEQDVVFDGIALVNLGGEAATVTAEALSAGGSVIATATLAADLASKAKTLAVFDSLVTAETAQIRVTSTQPAGAVVIRGTRGAQTPGFFWEVVPTTH